LLPSELRQPIDALLRSASITGPYDGTAIGGGGNNRVYRIDAGGKTVALKAYFRHPEDTRDRLGTEYAFTTFAWNAGLRTLPQPLAVDAKNHLALYEFIHGRRLKPGEVDGKAVDAALAFFAGLNKHRNTAEHLKPGSEACFSIAEHLAAVSSRIERHRHIAGDTADHRAAAEFVRRRLEPAWTQLRSGIERTAGSALAEPLVPALRCLSPSDFGFHNAILTEDGTFRFIDFEYAGWDDPAKLVGDFFNQVAVPVPHRHFDPFVAAVAAVLDDQSGVLTRRSKLLLPVYTIKWCCILLNEFHPVGDDRRHFAAANSAERKQHQLKKATQLLDGLDAARIAN
jgi:hypothetical protein